MADDAPRDRSEDVASSREHVLDAIVAFVRTLRRRGLDVPADGSVTAARVLATVGLDDEERARAALRAALVSQESDFAIFEPAFTAFWEGLTEGIEPTHEIAPEQGRRTPIPSTLPPDGRGTASAGTEPSDGMDPANVDDTARVDGARRRTRETTLGIDESDGDGPTVTASTYSRAGQPEHVVVPVAATEQDRDELDRAIEELSSALSRLRGRRFTRGGRETVDLRRAMRRSVGAGGAPHTLPRRDRDRTAVRATLLVDVSRSVLDAIDRPFLLRFLQHVRNRWRHTRVFFFDTELREVTGAFDEPNAAAASEALERAETEWGGGTRIGHSFDGLRREHPDAIDRETAVVVVSDGLEVGEIDRLERGMAWLRRRAWTVLWLNPLATAPEYEPICRGMEASLSYVDGLFGFAGAEGVAELARQLDRRGLDGPIGYRYDPRRVSN